jgi:hypothetical protein
MAMSVQPATPGAKGIDCITILTSASAARLKAAGTDFAVRYLGSLTKGEAQAILGAGMALLVVGFSRKPGWSPSAALGASDGAAAVLHAQEADLPAGLTLFCDFETPSASATAQDCIDYINAWAKAVRAAGFRAGLYVGFGVPLTSQQLYHDLIVDCYWRAGNAPQTVAVRGYCMKQSPQFNQIVAGIEVDADEILTDALGGVPFWLVDDGSLPAAA